jgi:hypothetical protein
MIMLPAALFPGGSARWPVTFLQGTLRAAFTGNPDRFLRSDGPRAR